MKKLFEIEKFDSYKEDNRREVKKANGGLPNDMWETYSAYANTYGGVIILGVKELDNKHWKTTGLKATDREKLLDNLWNSLHNPNKVNMNLLTEKDVSTYEVGEDIVIVIEVPMAKRSQKPIYINNDMFNGTYRRTHSGDYKCTRLQVKAMLRDQTENTVDMDILDEAEMSDLNTETVQGYRNRHRTLKAGHPFERLDDAEYLRSIGAAAISKEDKQLHLTAAGMLMFGNEFNIVRHFPEYFWIIGKCLTLRFAGQIGYNPAPANGLEMSAISISEFTLKSRRTSRYLSKPKAAIALTILRCMKH